MEKKRNFIIIWDYLLLFLNILVKLVFFGFNDCFMLFVY